MEYGDPRISKKILTQYSDDNGTRYYCTEFENCHENRNVWLPSVQTENRYYFVLWSRPAGTSLTPCAIQFRRSISKRKLVAKSSNFKIFS